MSEKRIRIAITTASTVFSGYFILGALVLVGLQLRSDRFIVTAIVGLLAAALGYLLGAGMRKRNRLASSTGLFLTGLLLFLVKSPASSTDWFALVSAGLLVLITGWGTVAVFFYHHNKRLAYARLTR